MLEDYIATIQENPVSGLDRVLLSGWVISKFEGRTFVKMTISVGDNKGNKNFPVIYDFKKEDGSSSLDRYMLHDYISVFGHLSSNQKSRDNAEETKQQQIVVDRVLRPRMVNHKYVDVNNVALKGELIEIKKGNIFTNAVMDVVTNEGIHNPVNVFIYGDMQNSIKVGQEYEFRGYVKTKRKIFKNSNKRPIHYQDVIITKLVNGIKLDTDNIESELDELDKLLD